tara:strand:+ start:944 stop:2038 length:1095 start_codon:yes stop_codon:yes gene_type:complete
MKQIKVFIVDDSAVVRKVLTTTLNDCPHICVIGSAMDPIFALKHMEKEWPDVITLDIEMPRMDGLTFLKKIMSERPTPVVMCSTLTEKGSRASVQALSYGAIDVIAKPKGNVNQVLSESSKLLCDAIRAAAKVNIGKVKIKPTIANVPPLVIAPKVHPDNFVPEIRKKRTGFKLPFIAIGTSTGGTQALELVLTQLPINIPPILIVQHMPEKFTKAFAERLNSICQIEVREAVDNDKLRRGVALIAPGGRHMIFEKNATSAFVRVKDGPLVSRHKPSVDVLFRSVSQYADEQVLGIIMTGMGDDGAIGLKAMRDHGAYTLGQDENSCVVYGMPSEAQKKGGVCLEVSLQQIPNKIIDYFSRLSI